MQQFWRGNGNVPKWIPRSGSPHLQVRADVEAHYPDHMALALEPHFLELTRICHAVERAGAAFLNT
jgi:hypothetical protein